MEVNESGKEWEREKVEEREIEIEICMREREIERDLEILKSHIPKINTISFYMLK